jgi:hypothetical protein
MRITAARDMEAGMIRRIGIYLGLLAGVAVFAGLFVVIFGNSTKVECARDAGQAPNCRITKSLLGQVQVSSRDILGVTDIQLDRSCDDGCSYRAVFVTAGGEGVPLNDVYTDQGPVMKQMEAFSGFLNGGGTAFEYEEPVPWWVVALTGGMGLIGMAVLAVNFVRDSMRD